MSSSFAPLPPDALPPPELAHYRGHTIGMLRRYFSMSVELGRLPGLLGREIFRSRHQVVHAASFEDLIIYVRDVERCLDRLRPTDRQLIVRVILQEHSYRDAARLLHSTARTVRRRMPEVLDLITDMFLDAGLIRLLVTPPPPPETVTLAACADEHFACDSPVSTFATPDFLASPAACQDPPDHILLVTRSNESKNNYLDRGRLPPSNVLCWI